LNMILDGSDKMPGCVAFALKTNCHPQPLGIDTPRPEFAWKIASLRTDVRQCAYQIQVAGSSDFIDLCWDSGIVASEEQWEIEYAGTALQSSTRYLWRVRVWDQDNTAGPWSDVSWFETGILDVREWRAHWVGSPSSDTSESRGALYLRGRLYVLSSVVRARAYVTALGWYRFFVNARDLTGNALVPRWTPLDHIVEYQTYDVTDSIHQGVNVVAMAIGDGRFRGRLGAFDQRAIYGDRLAGYVQLELQLIDGSRLTFVTDQHWRAGSGRILESDPKFGERVDLRVAERDWLEEHETPARFAAVQVLPASSRKLVGEEVAPVREVDRIKPLSVVQSPSGAQIVDFGQNFAGYAQVCLPAAANENVQLTFGELLTPAGELYTQNLVLPRHEPWYQRDSAILSDQASTFTPWFTVHGFRYMEIRGLNAPLEPKNIEGIVLSSDLPLAGTFECSDARLNQLHRNVFWSMRSNFADTPTDCPTRERAGWTGDIQVFAPTACKLADVQAFLRRYLRNLALEQLPEGIVPVIIPAQSSSFSGGLAKMWRRFSTSSGWGDACMLLPWTLYQYYGDRTVLRCQYDSMRQWVDYLERTARTEKTWRRWLRKRGRSSERYILDCGFHFGEWLRPGESFLGSLLNARVHFPVVATAYFAHSSCLLSRIASVLGREDDARLYAELSMNVRQAWQRAFIRSDGRIGQDKQDDYVRALAFDLVPAEQRPHILARLVSLIERSNYHLGTGFLSTPLILEVLGAGGRADIAYRVLLQNTGPAWLAQIERGATTTWETWEGYDAKGNGKGSHNHYAFGAVVRWLYEGIAGLAPIAPGYRHIRIAPSIGGGLSYARSSIETPLGRASSAWNLERSTVTLEATVPPGCRADVHLGDGRVEHMGSGTRTFRWQHAARL
jgi:alpha-L-rhamnosidase